MELIRNFPRQPQAPTVASLGNFDGVHLGHQAIVKILKTYAARHSLPSTVIVFEPQPREYFSPHTVAPRLTSLREKYQAFEALGIDRLICLRFDDVLANLAASEFVKTILFDRLKVRHLAVGDDFRFGKAREGDSRMLRHMASELGFQLVEVPPYTLAWQRVSSTLIRQALAEDDLEQASMLLGRAYSLSGRVIHGDKRGRKLGFPTANIAPRRQSAVAGVYITRTVIEKSKTCYPSVTSIGFRPMFDDGVVRLETHLMDFDKAIYGRYLRVDFLHKLRSEMRYADVAELRQAITDDVDAARHYFSEHDFMEGLAGFGSTR